MDNILTETVDNGEIENVHLSPIGYFKGSTSDGSAIDEHITADSLQRIADDLNSNGEEVLMDIDHASTRAGNKKNTEAVGWFYKFVVDPIKGLFANLKLTKRGKELIENREYRFVSPTFALDENGEPALLHSVAATNLPAFKGHIKPILNTESEEILTNNNKDILTMSKEELISLIKETVIALNSEPCSCASEEEVKEEEVKEEVENTCDEPKTEEVEKTEEVVNTEEVKEEVEEKTETVEEEKKEEPKAKEIKEEKEEVIKLEVLNSAPTPTLKKDEEWKHLHGRAFFDYIAKHPEVYNQ